VTISAFSKEGPARNDRRRRRDADVSEHRCEQRGAQRSAPGAAVRALSRDRFTIGRKAHSGSPG